MKIRSDLDNDSRNYISLHEYYQLCETYKLTDRKDVLNLSSYLHDLGVCLHFQDDREQRDFVRSDKIALLPFQTTSLQRDLENQRNESFNSNQNTGTSQQIRIESLNKDKEKLKKDYKAVDEKKRMTSNPQEINNLQLQLDSILKRIKEIEQQL